jgi:hypothetical protein
MWYDKIKRNRREQKRKDIASFQADWFPIHLLFSLFLSCEFVENARRFYRRGDFSPSVYGEFSRSVPRWNFYVTESDYARFRSYAGDDALIVMTLYTEEDAAIYASALSRCKY